MSARDIHKIVEFEKAVYDAFPFEPIPGSIKDSFTQFHQEYQKLISGKKWNEVIGRCLNYGGLYVHHSTWLELLPIDVCKYYLPSHLILASLLFSYEAEISYHWNVMESLILPPCLDEEVLGDIERELSLQIWLWDSADSRIALYKSMTFEQRSCVAKFLELYMEFGFVDVTERGIELYKKNIEYWRNSSLPRMMIDGNN